MPFQGFLFPAEKKTLENQDFHRRHKSIEADEAFAAQSLDVGKEMEFDKEIVNGGAIAEHFKGRETILVVSLLY
ncbi:Thiolase, C-terminal domain [Bacillus sp. OV322]|nr:Thiolase, C-terminal domain [Bacillus sp. OV322]